MRTGLIIFIILLAGLSVFGLEQQSVSYFPWLLGGILLLTIGKIMEQGIKLREEQELTI